MVIWAILHLLWFHPFAIPNTFHISLPVKVYSRFQAKEIKYFHNKKNISRTTKIIHELKNIFFAGGSGLEGGGHGGHYMTTEGSTLLSNSQLRHAGGVATPRLEGGVARGVSGERLQLNTGLHRHNLTGDREFKVSEDTNLVLSRKIVLREDLYCQCRENYRKILLTPLLP